MKYNLYSLDSYIENNVLKEEYEDGYKGFFNNILNKALLYNIFDNSCFLINIENNFNHDIKLIEKYNYVKNNLKKIDNNFYYHCEKCGYRYYDYVYRGLESFLDLGCFNCNNDIHHQ